MMADESGYAAWVAGGRKDAPTAPAVLPPVVTPDKAIAAIVAGDVTGGPPIMNEADQRFAMAAEAARKRDLALKAAPKAAVWLNDTRNAAASSGDEENITWFEREAPRYSGAENIAAGIAERAGAVVTEFQRFRQVMGDWKAGVEEGLGLPSVAEWKDGRIVFRQRTDAERAAGFAPRAGVNRSDVAALEAIPEFYRPGRTWEDVKSRPLTEFLPWALEQGIISSPDMAAAVVALPYYVAARTGEIGQARAGNQLREDATVGDLLAALPAAAASAALERLGSRGILGLDDALKGGWKGVLVAAAKGGVLEAGTEASQETVEALGEGLGTSKGVDPNLPDRVAQAGAGGFGFGVPVRAATASVEAQFGEARRATDAAKANDAYLDGVAETAAKSALRKGNPAQFADGVNAAVAGSQTEAVFVDAEALVEYLQGGELPFEEALAATGLEQADIDRAAATGGRVSISMGQWAAKIAGTPMDTAMRPHLTLRPDGMTPSQAQDFDANAPELAAKIKAEREAAAAAQAETDAKEQSVRAALYAELSKDAGFGKAELDTMTETQLAAYRTLAARTGWSMDKVLEVYPISRVVSAYARREAPAAPAGPAGPRVSVAPAAIAPIIASTATTYGIDQGYLTALARKESSFNPAAGATTSSARGLYQFTEGTWVATVKAGGLAVSPDAARIAATIEFKRGRAVNVTPEQQAVLDLRLDPAAAGEAVARLTEQNRRFLADRLGRAPTAAELYMAHFAGSAGAGKLLAADDGALAAAILPAAAAANARIFYEGAGPGRRPRTVAEVKAVLSKGFSGEAGAAAPAAPGPVEAPIPSFSTDPAGAIADIQTSGPAEVRDGGLVFEQMAGSTARTAPLATMAEAIRMESRKKTRDEIWDATGWVRGEDRLWRFEIDDSKAELTPEAIDFLEDDQSNSDTPGYKPLQLQDIIQHDALFKAYPGLRTITVDTRVMPGAAAMFTPGASMQDGVISVEPSPVERFNLPRGSRRESLKSSLLHEIQHAIQEVEGFAKGAGASEAGLRAQGYGPALDKRIDQLRLKAPLSPDDLKDAILATYHAAAGEIEARQTQVRADYDADKRKLIGPDHGRDVPFGKGIAVGAKGTSYEAVAEMSVEEFQAATAKAGNQATIQLAAAYRDAYGIKGERPTATAQPREDVMKRIANSFEAMPLIDDSPEARAAYKAMATETMQMAEFLGDISAERWTGKGEPYPNSVAMMVDMMFNQHLWFYPTETDTYGAGEGTVGADDPMLADSGMVDTDGQPLLINDVFRIVHDFFGHTMGGENFGPVGELNAYLEHVSMYSATARPAVAAQTLMQNAWVNFGAHLRRADGTLPQKGDDDYVPLPQRRFADQKAALAPAYVMELADGLRKDGERQARVAERQAAELESYRSYRESQGLTGRPDRIEPVPDQDGFLTLAHWGKRKGLKRLNPNRWGDNFDFLPRDERNRIGEAPGRTYFGLHVGTDFGYAPEEGLGKHRYTAHIKAERFYDFDADPLNLIVEAEKLLEADEVSARSSAYEIAIQRAGFAGYWTNNPEIGLVAASFEPVAAIYEGATKTFYQIEEGSPLEGNRPVLYSALQRAVEASQTRRATPEQWAATLLKTPGVKREELEWSGVLEWLQIEGRARAPLGSNDPDSTGPIDREDLLQFVEANGVKIEEVVLTGPGERDYDAISDRASELSDEQFDEDYEPPNLRVEVLGGREADLSAMTDDEWANYLAEREGVPRGPTGNMGQESVQAWFELPPKPGAPLVRDPDTPDLFDPEVGPPLPPAGRVRYVVWDGDEDVEVASFATEKAAQDDLEQRLENHRDEAREEHWNDGTPDWAYEQAERELGGQDGDTKWSSYTIPDTNTESYTELLLTLPRVGSGPADNLVSHLSHERLVELSADGERALVEAVRFSSRGLVRGAPDLTNYDIIKAVQRRLGAKDPMRQSAPSTHWEQDDVFAHARFTSEDDGETLFIHEIQSDWHQKGRTEGYAIPADPAEIEAARAAYYDKQETSTQISAQMGNFLKEHASELIAEHIAEQRATITVAVTRFEELAAAITATPGLETGRIVEEIVGLARQARQALDAPGVPAMKDILPGGALMRVWMADLVKGNRNADGLWEHAEAYKGARHAAIESEAYNNNRFEQEVSGETGWRDTAVHRAEYLFGRLGQVDAMDYLQNLRVEVYQARLRVNEAAQRLKVAEGTGITDAPFKNTWPALTMKRLIRYAVDTGHAKIVLPTASQIGPVVGKSEGMEWFYGRNLVNLTNDVIKKYGARLEPQDGFLGRAAPDVTPENRDLLAMSRTEQEAELGRIKAILKDTDINISDPSQEGEWARLDILRELLTYEPNLGFTITPELAAAAKGGFTLFQRSDPTRPRAPQGSVSFEDRPFGLRLGQGRRAVISLTTSRNITTPMHEFGHVYLEMLGSLALRDDVGGSFREDMEALRSWFNTPPDAEIGTREHEMFAEAFEQYLYEGRAPSVRLTRAFENFKAWFMHIYRRLRGRRLDMTDEVRTVFDRMLATDEEITQARAQQGMVPLLDDPAAQGLTPELAAAYSEVQARAHAEASAEADARVLAAVARQQKQWFKDRRDEVEGEVNTEIAAEPVYRAFEWLAHGAWLHEEPPEGLEPFKLSKADIEADYGAGAVDELPRGQGRVYAVDGGVHPDIAAEVFGFETGGELLRALAEAPKRREAVKAETDRRMVEEFGDPAVDGTLPDVAMEAIHSRSAERGLELEVQALTGRPAMKGLSEAARRDALDRKVGDLMKPDKHLVAERRAGLAAQRAFRKGDLAVAAKEKLRQLVAFVTWRATRNAADEIDKGDALFKKVIGGKDAAIAKTRNMDFVQAARAILGAYGIGKARQNPMAYMALIREYDPDLAEALEPQVLAATEASGKGVEQLTYSEFIGLRDAVSSLWRLSRRSKVIENDGRLIELSDAADDLGLQITGQIKLGRNGEMTEAMTDGQKLLRGLAGVRHALRRVESWAHRMDGGVAGPFTRLIWRPISEAADRHRAYSGEKRAAYAALLETIRGGLSWNKIKAPEIGHTFANKSELLHALLHTGNLSNKRKLLLGGRGAAPWATEDENGEMDTSQWDALLARLISEGVITKADYDFAQGVWDLLESTKPLAQKAHRTVYGRYFDEVSADTVSTPFGDYRGGYVPASIDTDLVQDASLRAEAERINEGGRFMFPTPARGFTKSREENYTKPLALDLRLLAQHIDKVSMFAHLAAPVRDALRLLNQPQVNEPLAVYDPVAMKDLLLPWLGRSATQTVSTPMAGEGGKLADKFFRGVRSRTGQQTMFFNLVNSLQQVTGFTLSMLKVKPRYLGGAMWAMIRDPGGMAAAIAAASPMMADRLESQTVEAAQDISTILTRPNLYTVTKDFTDRHTYFLQHAFQNAVDTVTWLGAHTEAEANGADPKEAVRLADAAVRQTQGSLNPEDVSRFETGPAFARMFTQYTSYFNMQANLLLTEQAVAVQNRDAGRMAWVHLVGFSASALIADAIRISLTQGWNDDEDDGYLDEVLSWFFGSQFRGAVALIPAAGPAINAGINALNKVPYDDRMSVSPGLSAIEAASHAPADIVAVAKGEGDLSRAVKDTLTLMGLITGLPLAALGRPLGYMADVAEGDVEPTGPVDAMRGAVTGSASEASRQ